MSRTISGHSTIGIKLSDPSDNPVVVVGNASIITTGKYALYGTAGLAWSITNDGTLQGSTLGVTLASGGTVVNAGAGSISAGTQGVYIVGGPGTIANYGRMAATNHTSTGAQVAEGLIVNGSALDISASISGNQQGVVTGYGPAGGLGTVVNFGTIANAIYHAVWLDSGGSLVNGSLSDTSALIMGTSFGEGVTVSRGPGSVTNFGTITGGSNGVDLSLGGSIINGSSSDTTASIVGRRDGVVIGSGPGTVTNYGTITGSGGVAVAFGGRNSRLVDHPGAVFAGRVLGGAGSNILELAAGSGMGSVSGIGTSFTNFNNVVLDPGAHWVLHRNNQLGTGSNDGRITVRARAGLAIRGTLDVSGTVSLAGPGNVRGIGTIAIDAGSVLDAGRLNTHGVQFLAGGEETLELHRPSAVSGTITGFGQVNTNAIDLVGAVATSIEYTTLSPSSGLLTVKGAGGSLAALHFSGGNYSTSQFHFAVAGGSTNITFG